VVEVGEIWREEWIMDEKIAIHMPETFGGTWSHVEDVLGTIGQILKEGPTKENLEKLDQQLSKCSEEEKKVIRKSIIKENHRGVTSCPPTQEDLKKGWPVTKKSAIEDIENSGLSNPAWPDIIDVLKINGI